MSSPREICDRERFRVGTVLTRVAVSHEWDLKLLGMTMRITAIGDDGILARYAFPGRDYGEELHVKSGEFMTWYEVTKHERSDHD